MMETPRPDPEALEFTGTGREYFRIWIVNVVLTLATLGIYSAWAKVRRHQYFCRHTRLAGATFDYHGDPVAILRGRILGGLLFGVYSVAGYLSPATALAALGLVGGVLPWMLAKSFRFRAHNTSYRGLRFRFTGSLGGAYFTFLVMPVFTLLTVFLAGPLWHHRIREYQHANAWYGQQHFTYEAEAGDFYLAYLFAGLLGISSLVLSVLGLVVLSVAFRAVVAPTPDTVPTQGTMAALTLVFLLVYAVVIVAVQSVLTARIQNLVWNQTFVGGHRFVYRLAFGRLFAIRLTNLLATLTTLGLYRPFAQVRLARYMAGAFTLVPYSSLDDFVAAESPDVTAVGEGAADAFDFDIAF